MQSVPKPLNYSSNVLVANWFEESESFIPHKNVYRTDYEDTYKLHNVCSGRRDSEVIRRHCWARNDISKSQLSFIDQECRSSTTYDNEFNHPEKSQKQLPEGRCYNVSRNSWLPEKIDLPLIECPQNWGLLKIKTEKWKNETQKLWEGDYITIYENSYNTPKPVDSYKVDHKIRMEGRSIGNFDKALKKRYNFANQWLKISSEGCLTKPNVKLSARKSGYILPNLGDDSPSVPTESDTSKITSKYRYGVPVNCSENILNKAKLQQMKNLHEVKSKN